MMPFAMFYPPSMTALPDLTSPFPRFCDFPRPRFAENPAAWPQESEPRQRRTTTPLSTASTFTASSAALPPTRKRRNLAKNRPKTPYPDHIRPRPQERTPLSQYVIAALAGCAQCSTAFPVPTTANSNFNSPPTSTGNHRTRDEYQRASRAAAPITPTPSNTATRFTEQLPLQEEHSEEHNPKTKGRKRENLKKCGRKIGSWIVTLCSGRRENQSEENGIKTTTQRLEEEMVSEKEQSVPGSGALGIERKRISSASEVTLVDADVEPVATAGDEIQVQAVIRSVNGSGSRGGGDVRVSPGRVYTGH